MHYILRQSFILLLSITLLACLQQPKKSSDQKAIIIDGKLNESIWEHQEKKLLYNLSDERKTSALNNFQYYTDQDNFYFAFSIQDKAIIQRKLQNEENIWEASDRVELFFTQDSTLNKYFGLEITPSGLYSDFKGAHYRKLDFDWSWPKDGIKIKTSTVPDGYLVEGRINLTMLKRLDLIKNNKTQVAILRANYYNPNDFHGVHWYNTLKLEKGKIDFHTIHAFEVLSIN